jgi:C4-dicarboxylate-binding protein DctP
MKPIFAVAVALLLGAAMTPARADGPIILKFSHVVAPDTPKGKAAEKFKELAEERTKGRVKVEVYPNSQLYKDKEELEALQLGAVQMLAPATTKFGPLGIKEFEAFDLPYIFLSIEALRKVSDGPIAQKLFKKLEPKGIIGLGFWDNGFTSITTANRPIRKPEDLKGLKMRIQSSKALETEYRDMGALPQILAFSEVYQALQTGVVDGQENSPSNIYTQKFHEVQKYLTVTDNSYIGYVLIVNKKFWEGLPPDIRSALDSAVKDATHYCNSIAETENADALAKIKQSGIEFYELTPQEKAQWRKSLLRVHEEMASRIGKDLIQDIYKETGESATQ